MDSPVWAALVEIKAKIEKLALDQAEQPQAEEDFVIPEKDLRMELGRERTEHQATLNKLTGLNQELATVRKDFEEYKATNDAKWETMEEKVAQIALGLGGKAEAKEASGPATAPKGALGLEAKPKECPCLSTKTKDLTAEPKGSGLSAKPESTATEPKDLTTEPKGSGLAAKAASLSTKPEDPQTLDLTEILRLKIAYLEATVHSKTSQIDKMENEHAELISLMAEQIVAVYSLLQSEPQTLDPRELKDARIEALEERNAELRMIIQASVEQSDHPTKDFSRDDLAHANTSLRLRLGDFEAETENLRSQVTKLTKKQDELKERLKTEAGMRACYFRKVTRLRELIADQAQKHCEQLALRDAAFANALEKVDDVQQK